jgi:hypothetical protein
LRKRLWQCGLGWALFLLVLVIGNFFTPADKSVSRKSAGHDFLAFYTGGTFIRTGRSAQLYDLNAIGAFQRDLAKREGLELPDDVLGPFWNPPFFAWVFAPISALPYHTAWLVWFGINLACLAGAIVLMARMVGGDWRIWGLVPLLIITSPPFIQAVGHGQNTCLSLLLLSGTIALWRSQRGILAGMICGLLFYKPQLGAILAVAMIIQMGFKPLVGLALTGIALLLTTILTLPGTLADYLQRLPDNIAYMQVEHRYLWDRHVTFKALWRLLLQGYEIGDLSPLTRTLYIASVALLASFLLVTIWKLRRDVQSRDRLIAATIVAMPLLMPFYFDYDLLLLSAAAVLTAREAVDLKLVWLWVGLFACCAVNSSIAGRTHVNLTVALLTMLSARLIAGAARGVAMSVEERFQPQTVRQAA